MNVHLRHLPKGTWANLHIGPNGKHNVRPLVIVISNKGIDAHWLRGHKAKDWFFPPLRMGGSH